MKTKDKKEAVKILTDFTSLLEDVKYFSRFYKHYSKPEQLIESVLALREALSHFSAYLASRKDK